MNINDEIKRIRQLLADGKTRNESGEALPKAPTIELIVNGELHVDRVPATGLKVGVDYDTMQADQNNNHRHGHMKNSAPWRPAPWRKRLT